MSKKGFWVSSQFRKKEGSDELIVVFSPSKKMTFFRTDFPASVLFMADQLNTYYTHGAPRTATIIKRLAYRTGARRVLLIGPSKGGFASLMFAKLLSSMDDSREYCALAFSPQTQVYPQNPNIPFPTYVNLIKRAQSNASILQSLEAFGDATKLGNVRAAIVYGAGNRDDSLEVQRVSGRRLTLIPLPLTGHSSSLPFLCDTTKEDEVVEVVRKLTAAAKDQEDLSLRQRSEVMIQELMAIPRVPSLSTACRMVLDGKERDLRVAPEPEFRMGPLRQLFTRLSRRFA